MQKCISFSFEMWLGTKASHTPQDLTQFMDVHFYPGQLMLVHNLMLNSLLQIKG